MRRIFLLIGIVFALLLAPLAGADTFRVGYAERDVTPKEDMPMWGYGARRDLLSQGAQDPLYAKGVVIEVGGEKLALVGLDLGRSPTHRSMGIIQDGVRERAGVRHVMMSGSHTHHGPVLELVDEEGKGRGKFDQAVAYVDFLEQSLIELIVEAAENVQDARIGWGSRDTDLNRNRHSKRDPRPRDPELAVVRFDDLDGEIIALMVNFAAHPTILSVMDRVWSADWPGHMQNAASEALETKVFFMQGAAGDLSPNTGEGRRGIDGFGKAVAEQVVEIAREIETRVPERPSIQAKEETFTFEMRLDIHNPLIQGVFRQAFFPEMLAMLNEIGEENTIYPRLVTVLLNGELALVGGSGEFFCEHANRLKRDAKAKKSLFIGYCNGHQMYFPTRAGIDEGGYGADPAVAWAEPGAGEKMIDSALAQIEAFLDEL